MALSGTATTVRDCWTLLRLHQGGCCVKCGERGHYASKCGGLDRKRSEDLPFYQQRLERRLSEAPASTSVAKAAPRPTLPLASAQSSSGGSIALPREERGDAFADAWASWMRKERLVATGGWLKLADFLRAVGASKSEIKKAGRFIGRGGGCGQKTWRVEEGAPQEFRDWKHLGGTGNRGGCGSGALHVSVEFAQRAWRQRYAPRRWRASGARLLCSRQLRRKSCDVVVGRVDDLWACSRARTRARAPSRSYAHFCQAGYPSALPRFLYACLSVCALVCLTLSTSACLCPVFVRPPRCLHLPVCLDVSLRLCSCGMCLCLCFVLASPLSLCLRPALSSRVSASGSLRLPLPSASAPAFVLLSLSG